MLKFFVETNYKELFLCFCQMCHKKISIHQVKMCLLISVTEWSALFVLLSQYFIAFEINSFDCFFPLLRIYILSYSSIFSRLQFEMCQWQGLLKRICIRPKRDEIKLFHKNIEERRINVVSPFIDFILFRIKMIKWTEIGTFVAKKISYNLTKILSFRQT